MRGLLLAISAYGIWGCFPLFFSLLSGVSAFEVLAHRIVWAYFFTGLVILGLGRRKQLAALIANRRALAWLSLSAVLITINWLVFIWAVSAGRVLESSLGYFLTPLVSLFLGRLLLKESMNRLQVIAGLLATAAVLFELFALGRLPWVSLVLACSFGLYGLVRKMQPVDSLNGLQVETMVILPLALLYLVWLWTTGDMMFSRNIADTSLLITAGALTAVPLLLFAAAARRLDLIVVGFIMYLNPTLQFLSAVFILDEAYPPQRLLTFIVIWIAMGFFLAGMWQAHRRSRRVAS
jgi:chloramphenicol-sensitive protein RarD